MPINPTHTTLGQITSGLQARLDELTDNPASQSKPDSLASAVRAVLVDIASLQTKAKRTFGQVETDAVAWWVTRRGLQQSTHHRVAKLKASWMGDAPVVDVCCGLGSDWIALARRGPVTGIDIDPDVLAFAAANARVAGVTASLRQLDATDTTPRDLIADARLIHIDPDRRADGNRHTDADNLVPSWARVRELLAACRGGIVKLAPATRIPEEDAIDFHRTWISTSGSVREQSVLHGEVLNNEWLLKNAMLAGTRSAISVRGDVSLVFAAGDDATSTPHSLPSGLGKWLIDPDAAIRAAGLTQAFAAAIHARPVDSPSGFLTADSVETTHPNLKMAMVARVIDVVGCDDRKLRKFFRANDSYPEVIKVRGGDIDPASLTRRLRECGQTPLGLWIGRHGKRTYAAITELPTLAVV